MNAEHGNANGFYRLSETERRLSGWICPEQPSGDPPALGVICGDQLVKVVMAAAEAPAEAPAEALGFDWNLPDLLWDSAGALRVIELLSGKPLSGPDTIPGKPRPASAPDIDWGEEPRHWPAGLAGSLEGRVNLVTPGVFVIADSRAAWPCFARAAAPVVADTATSPGPDWALRVSAENTADWTVLQCLPRAAATLPERAQLRLWARVIRATSNLTLTPIDIFLSRRAGHGFETLRRLRLTRVGRHFSAIGVQLGLEPAEQALAAEGQLWLGVTVTGTAGIEVCPVLPAAELASCGFEDGRLAATFAACEQARAVMTAAEARDAPAAPAGDIPLTDIVLPVYNGSETVLRCLRALQSATDTPFRVQIIDDGSRAYTTRLLEEVAAQDERFRLHRRAINRGYTKSVNEGLKLTSADWIVILNSDTVVSAGWLRRLHQALRAVPGAGLAGPLSNAASWQSIPNVKDMDGRWSQNDFIEPEDVEQVQARLGVASRRGYPLFPILNGFCTLFSRAVFDTCGGLDEDAFPLGYGEETDLCLRAMQAGFKAVVADDCFVYHEKSVSFGSGTRAGLTRQGGFELKNKHPGLNIAALEQVMRTDPVLGALRLELAGLEAELRK